MSERAWAHFGIRVATARNSTVGTEILSHYVNDAAIRWRIGG